MKWSVGRFYDIRNLKPSQIPFSTARWDPKWFHEEQKDFHSFTDKRGIINGLKIWELVPEKLGCCGEDCVYKLGIIESSRCPFLLQYKKQLEESLTDFIISYYENLCTTYKGDEIVLLVYENEDNPCSERVILKEVFKEKFNIILEEVVTGGSNN